MDKNGLFYANIENWNKALMTEHVTHTHNELVALNFKTDRTIEDRHKAAVLIEEIKAFESCLIEEIIGLRAALNNLAPKK